MKFANLVLATVTGMIASASFAAATFPNSVNLDCSVITDGLKDSSQIVGFKLVDDKTGLAHVISSDVLKKKGCEVRLIPNASGMDPEVAGSIFIDTKGSQLPFGFMLMSDVPHGCDANKVVTVPMHLAHTSPLKIVKNCLGE